MIVDDVRMCIYILMMVSPNPSYNTITRDAAAHAQWRASVKLT